MYDWFKRFSGCWISMQWTIPRYQSTSVIPTSSNTWKIGKRFCKSRCVLFSTWSAGIESMEFQNRTSLIRSGKEWEGLYKLRIRELEKFKTVLELYDLEFHQKKAGPDYHRLKTMVKRSFEQDLRNRNFEARNGNYERNAVVKNQGTKQRVQRILGDCWQWESNGQCSKGDNCSFRHDINKRAKTTAESLYEFFHAAEWEKCVENPKSQRKESQWQNVSMALQGSPWRNLHQFILWKVAPSRMLVLQDQEWLQMCGKVLVCTSSDDQPCKRSQKNDDKSADVHESVWQPVVNRDKSHERSGRTGYQSWHLSCVETRTCWASIIELTTFGLRVPGYGAAEVVVYLTEELRHAETNPTCKIHEGSCASHIRALNLWDLIVSVLGNTTRCEHKWNLFSTSQTQAI